MGGLWKSFRARLVVGSVVWILGGIAVSGLALAELFREHVTAQFDGELHGHAEELAALVDIDAAGRPYLHRRLSDPRFLPVGSGFYWQIERAGGGTALSGSLAGRPLTLSAEAPPVGPERHVFVDGPRGAVRLVERTVVSSRMPGEALRIAIGVDERELDAVLADFNRTLALSLGVIALGLVVAAFLQVSFGLRPLGRVRTALADVRSGRARRLPEDSPSEVRPLVHDLNALLEANEEMIRRARAQAGNLAHALKTPLAILADEGERLRAAGQPDASAAILAQCDRMRRQIDYQMARARAAASRSAPGAAADARATLLPILSAMDRLHGRRGVRYQLDCAEGVAVAVEAQDLAEMVANLLDNAGKWATREVLVTVSSPRDEAVRIAIEDDGPGLPPESWELVFDVGQRLDERAPGSGLGLPIVRDLANLYGGRVWLEAGRAGGLLAVLELPAARA